MTPPTQSRFHRNTLPSAKTIRLFNFGYVGAAPPHPAYEYTGALPRWSVAGVPGTQGVGAVLRKSRRASSHDDGWLLEPAQRARRAQITRVEAARFTPEQVALRCQFLAGMPLLASAPRSLTRIRQGPSSACNRCVTRHVTSTPRTRRYQTPTSSSYQLLRRVPRSDASVPA
jgi:hypothetical protein